MKTEVVKESKTMKSVNSPRQDVIKVAKDVDIQVGNVRSKMDISIVPMDASR